MVQAPSEVPKMVDSSGLNTVSRTYTHNLKHNKTDRQCLGSCEQIPDRFPQLNVRVPAPATDSLQGSDDRSKVVVIYGNI